MLRFNFGVQISTSLISKKLCGTLYTIKQRKAFGDALLAHEKKESLIVYYDDTNYNLYCKRSMGRAPVGERAVVKLLPSKGANLQLQCAISLEIGLAHWAKRRGSIKMEVNSAFVNDVYDAVKEHGVYEEHFVGKTIVIVLDSAPAHNQTEDLVRDREDLELLRFTHVQPHRRMLQCFKSKDQVLLSYEYSLNGCLPYGEMTERRMRLLEQAADRCMPCIDLRLVNRMARHCALSVAAAIRGEAMEYGT
ncbi:hypothetical protein PHMEG_00014319 [Phytophthora megakarya]|uniref:Tc1-like transposase DDE domain-containing protein n=1 Tax=Phytophthora megakarya TaxID=4795 RepID=A0A225W428_9STRA|nr:hypothetical protein PHMEG_00014319 [Phytophthora megakarya]